MTEHYDAKPGQVLRREDRQAVADFENDRWTPTAHATAAEHHVLAEAPAGWPPEIVASALNLAHAFGLR